MQKLVDQRVIKYRYFYFILYQLRELFFNTQFYISNIFEFLIKRPDKWNSIKNRGYSFQKFVSKTNRRVIKLINKLGGKYLRVKFPIPRYDLSFLARN